MPESRAAQRTSIDLVGVVASAAGLVAVTYGLIEAGQAKGADAILAMRFDVNELQGIGQEICAYGTAVKVVPAR